MTTATKPEKATPIPVFVWDEQQPEQRAIYPEFLGRPIGDHLAQQSDFSVRCAAVDDAEQGLHPRVLDETDVLVWWRMKEVRSKGLVLNRNGDRHPASTRTAFKIDCLRAH